MEVLFALGLLALLLLAPVLAIVALVRVSRLGSDLRDLRAMVEALDVLLRRPERARVSPLPPAEQAATLTALRILALVVASASAARPAPLCSKRHD